VIFRNSRTPSEYIGNGLYFYFSGLFLRKAVDSRLSYYFIKRNHVFLGKNETGSKSTSRIKYHQLEKEYFRIFLYTN
jgi:hypothetical protein